MWKFIFERRDIANSRFKEGNASSSVRSWQTGRSVTWKGSSPPKTVLRLAAPGITVPVEVGGQLACQGVVFDVGLTVVTETDVGFIGWIADITSCCGIDLSGLLATFRNRIVRPTLTKQIPAII